MDEQCNKSFLLLVFFLKNNKRIKKNDIDISLVHTGIIHLGLFLQLINSD